MVNFRFLVGIFIFSVAAFAVHAQPSAQIDTADWANYRNDKFGFEVKYPKSLHENSITGTVDNIPIERVEFNDKTGKGIQFVVQRGINPNGLSFDQWTADQLKKFNKAPPQLKNVTIGGRPAILLNQMIFDYRSYSFHVSLNKTDILTILIRRPSTETQLDQTYEAILSTIKFLN